MSCQPEVLLFSLPSLFTIEQEKGAPGANTMKSFSMHFPCTLGGRLFECREAQRKGQFYSFTEKVTGI